MSGYFSTLLHHIGLAFGSPSASHPVAVTPLEVHERRLVDPTPTGEAPADVARAAPRLISDEEPPDASSKPSLRETKTASQVLDDHGEGVTESVAAIEVEGRVDLPSPSERVSSAGEPAAEIPEAPANARSPAGEPVERQVSTVHEAGPALGEQPALPSLEEELWHEVPSQGLARPQVQVRRRRPMTREEAGERRARVWRQVYGDVRQWVDSSPESSEAELDVVDERVMLVRAKPATQEHPTERPVLVTENQELQLSIGRIEVSLEAPVEEHRSVVEQHRGTGEARSGRSRLRRHYLRMP